MLNWVLDMSEFEFEPVHRAGSSHNNADALSRLRVVNYSEMNYFNWWGHDPESVCIKCQTPQVKASDDILICDYCMRNFHQQCHKPRVAVIPEGSWYCSECSTSAK